MVPTALMCRQHLLGEHKELHMLAGALEHDRSLDGYINAGLVQLGRLRLRHRAIAAEMKRRGYSHRSPMTLTKRVSAGHVDVADSWAELIRRCPECRALAVEELTRA